MSAGKDLASLIILGLSLVPMLHSSTSESECSIVGLFATSSKSKRSSKGASPQGIFLSFDCNTSISSFFVFLYSSVGFPSCLVKVFISTLCGDFSSSEGSSLRQFSLDLEFELENSNSFLQSRKSSIFLSPSKTYQYFSLSSTAGLYFV